MRLLFFLINELPLWLLDLESVFISISEIAFDDLAEGGLLDP